MICRKLAAGILVMTMCAGLLSGCGGKESESKTAENPTPTEQAPETPEEDPEKPEEKEEASLIEFDFSNVTKSKEIAADGSKALSDEAKLYDGLGMVSANNSSRLLLDYKSENPEVYWKLLEYMFGEDGMGLSLIKIEMGADADTSSGTEPAVMRSEEEPADVTRGAGYQLAADALTINPNLKVDLLYWAVPNWVANAEDSYDALYQWYKSTIDAMYDTYGIQVTHVTATRNERAIDTEWVKYFSERLKAETDERYDYDTIKIVAGEAVGGWGIADKMLKDEALMSAVDVVTSHYTSWTSDKVKTLQNEYGKEVWFSEGSSPMSYAASTYRYDGTGSGISDINGMLDIATRITQAMTEGMTMYEFQPVISAYYSGVTYYPKQLITANEPWSGAYSLDAGFYMTLHFTQFIKDGWQYIDGACYGDGTAGGDGHAIVDSTFNYITCVDESKENCSVVLVNNSGETIEYTIRLSNLSCAEDKFYVWETKGPDEGDDNYYGNFFREIGYVLPEDGTVKVVLQPYSMMTVSTLEVDRPQCEEVDSAVLELPYSDDFEYGTYDDDFLESRGAAPRYTTDQGGAFEVAETADENVLMQKITDDKKPLEWGWTSDPVTNLGDDRWANYSVSVDVHFADAPVENAGTNYVGIGARYNLADSNTSGYWLKLEENGNYALMKDGSSLENGTLTAFDSDTWHSLQITVCQTVIECSIDGEKLLTYEDTQSVINSGRVGIYSAYQMNYFDNLSVQALDGYEPYITRVDNFDSEITYSEGSNAEDGIGWYHNTMCSYKNYNRTVSEGSVGDSLEFDFEGSGFAVIGDSDKAMLLVEIDGETVAEEYTCSGGTRKASYYIYGLEEGKHSVKITVLGGTFEVDVIEY